MRNSFARGAIASPMVGLVAGTLAACGGGGYGGGGGNQMTPPPPAPQTGSAFSMTKLISDGSVAAQGPADQALKNPWGIVFAPGAPVWISNNGTQTSTLYDGTGVKVPLVVSIPAGLNGDSSPTGVVANASATDFAVTKAPNTAAAKFIFASESGTISGWAPTVDGTHAIIGYDDGPGHAIYKGLAIAANGTANFLYATDFHNNKIDVFNATYQKVATTGGFVDTTLPAGFAPFGIQTLQVQNQTLIFVTYAKQDADKEDEVDGAGLGMVNVFDVNGTLQKHLVATGAALNAPWGLTLAPASFGTLANMLLVGNFGDGSIDGYDPVTGAFIGAVSDNNNQPIKTPGLWGIAFGNGARNQSAGTLYFAAGTGGETGGVYGRIDLGAAAPDTVAPTVALTAPAAGNVIGMVTVTANAADNVGVTQVQFLAGATAIGTATTAPFTVQWDTSAIAGGTNVSVTAQAKDAAGNVTTSAAVAVTVTH